MIRAIQLQRPGGVENLKAIEFELAPPSPGEVRLRHTAIGVNFVDLYQRSGLYPLPGYPAILGVEAAGVVEAVGAGVTDLAPGDRVVWAGAPIGGYASVRHLPAERAIRIPDSVSDETAGVALSRGLTVQMLQTQIFPVKQGDRVLVHSAAGGLGQLLLRTAKRRGAWVIATVSSSEKAEQVRALGADAVIIGRDADFAAEVARLTEGRLVDVAYDGVGGSTLRKTLGCVRPFGTVASFGQSGGAIPPLAVTELGPQRSLMLARPSVMHFMTDLGRYRAAADEVMRLAAEGLSAEVGSRYPLAEAARAQADLEAGHTTGCAVLIP